MTGEQSNAVRCPQMGWVQPRKRSSFLDSKIKKLCLKDTANDPRKSAGRKWFSSVPGARSYKNKNWRQGGQRGESLNNSFPNSEEAISYFLSWKASWFTKIQVHVFGSDVAIGVASQCQPVSGLLPVRVQFPLWCCAGARASESSWIALCTNVKDFPV